MWISHRKEIRKLTFRAQALRRSESRNCGLCVVYIQKYGATLLVGAWQREKQQNKLVEWKAFVDTVRIKSAELKNNFCSRVFRLSVFPWCRERPQTAICCKLYGRLARCVSNFDFNDNSNTRTVSYFKWQFCAREMGWQEPRRRAVIEWVLFSGFLQ